MLRIACRRLRCLCWALLPRLRRSHSNAPIRCFGNPRTSVDVEAVDFEMDDDDLMDEEVGAEAAEAPTPKLRSAITGAASAFTTDGSGGVTKKTKGRGFREEAAAERTTRLAGKEFDSDGGPGPQQCELFSLVGCT